MQIQLIRFSLRCRTQVTGLASVHRLLSIARSECDCEQIQETHVHMRVCMRACIYGCFSCVTVSVCIRVYVRVVVLYMCAYIIYIYVCV